MQELLKKSILSFLEESLEKFEEIRVRISTDDHLRYFYRIQFEIREGISSGIFEKKNLFRMFPNNS